MTTEVEIHFLRRKRFLIKIFHDCNDLWFQLECKPDGFYSFYSFEEAWKAFQNFKIFEFGA